MQPVAGRCVEHSISQRSTRVQYIWRIQRYQAGLFLEVYNLTNHVNFGDPSGARNSTNFMTTIVADNLRTAQLGVRLIF
jgi:hypothetical protein